MLIWAYIRNHRLPAEITKRFGSTRVHTKFERRFLRFPASLRYTDAQLSLAVRLAVQDSHAAVDLTCHFFNVIY